jgi:hypothetical protein
LHKEGGREGEREDREKSIRGGERGRLGSL